MGIFYFLFFCGDVAANLRIAGALEKSTQVMTSMQQLVKVPEVMATMREMSKEMMKVSRSCDQTLACNCCCHGDVLILLLIYDV